MCTKTLHTTTNTIPLALTQCELKLAQTYLAPATNNKHLAHALFTTKFT